MLVTFVGGPLDGELREVRDDTDTYLDFGKRPEDMTAYHIANGIARHESVSEEEVAREVYGWYLSADAHRS